jgi:hypothetical protein
MSLTIFELDEEMKAAEEAIEKYAEEHEGDITDCPFNDILENLQMQKEDKCLNVAAWIKNLKAEAGAIEGEKKALYKRESALKNKAERLTNYLEFAIKPGEKLQNSRAVIGWRKSTAILLHPDFTPEQFPSQFTKTEITISKTAVKEAMQGASSLIIDGIEYAKAETRQNIQIK